MQEQSIELSTSLKCFIGTEKYHQQIWPVRITDEDPATADDVLTDGVQYFAEKGGAFWFVDIVNTEIAPLLKPNPDQYFIAVTLISNKEGGSIVATDGNEKVLYTKMLDVCMVPEGTWEFYIILEMSENPVIVMMLPSEY